MVGRTLILESIGIRGSDTTRCLLRYGLEARHNCNKWTKYLSIRFFCQTVDTLALLWRTHRVWPPRTNQVILRDWPYSLPKWQTKLCDCLRIILWVQKCQIHNIWIICEKVECVHHIICQNKSTLWSATMGTHQCAKWVNQQTSKPGQKFHLANGYPNLRFWSNSKYRPKKVSSNHMSVNSWEKRITSLLFHQNSNFCGNSAVDSNDDISAQLFEKIQIECNFTFDSICGPFIYRQ